MANASPPEELMQSFGLGDAELVAQTGIARVWRCRAQTGPVALKVYDGRDMRNEDRGVDLLRAMKGQGVVGILGQAPGAVLMEWLEGPSLGDLSRAGRDDEAALHLGEVAQTFAAAPQVAGLSTLDHWITDLFDLTFAPDCPPRLVADIRAAQVMARALLASAPAARPLHGDLHHDNVRHGARGWTAFDAKGVLGDPTFELANAFRNPKGAADLMRSTTRIRRCAAVWSHSLNLDPARLLRWAAVKVALSIAWRSGPVLQTDDEADLLSLMLSEADRA